MYFNVRASPAVTLAPKINVLNLVRITEIGNIIFPQPGRGHSVTNYGYRQKVIKVFAEEMFQAGALARRAAKQNARRLERVSDLTINISDLTLNVFTAAQIFKFVEIFCRGMDDAEVFVEARPEDDASAL